jgi:RNA recognition motif-containing protein
MKTTEPTKDDLTVYISNLSYKIDYHQLKRIFSHFGEVRQVKVVMNQETQTSKGMAFVRMSKVSEVKKAIDELDGQIIDGRTVKASHAIPMAKAPKPAIKLKSREERGMAPIKDQKLTKNKKKGPVSLKDFLASKAHGTK